MNKIILTALCVGTTGLVLFISHPAEMPIAIAPALASLSENNAQILQGEPDTLQTSVEEALVEPGIADTSDTGDTEEPEESIAVVPDTDVAIPDTDVDEPETLETVPAVSTVSTVPAIPTVPFFSQFKDITAPEWKKVGCGIASLAMLIELYNPGKVNVDTLLGEGITAHAFLSDAGWTYAGLIGLSQKYGLSGETHDMRESSMESAFARLESSLNEGPVMASVHYTFDPQNPIPHLVIVNGVGDGMVYYNDPAEPSGGGSVSITQFKSAWKKRYIEIRPVS